MKRNYWDILIDDPDFSKEELFLKIRDLYTALMKHLFDDASDIPEFKIYFCDDQIPLEQGHENGYPISMVTRRTNNIERSVIRDVTQIENYENAYIWYRDDIFIVFDFREEDGISVFTFITQSFMTEVFNTLITQGVRKMRMAMMSELIISTGIVEFFYGFYSLDINFLQNLSAATYESNYANSRIIVSRTDGHGVRRTRRSGLKVAFTDPIDFSFENLRQIRKFMELSNDTFALVIGENRKIKGLTEEEAEQNECEIQIRGHLAWTITYDGSKTISYNNGHYHIYVPHTAELNLHNFLATLEDPISQEQVDALSLVIQEAAKQTSGTIVMIGSVPEVASETIRITDMKYAIGISAVNLAENKEIISSITAIDGAILMDTNCVCSCIGAILDGDVVTRGSMARGARFNSAHNYVKRRSQLNQHFTAFVISEDGTVDAINEEKVYRININRE